MNITTPRLLRLRDVIERTGLARSTIYELMAEDEFPRSVKLGRRTVAWHEADINEWIETRPETARR